MLLLLLLTTFIGSVIVAQEELSNFVKNDPCLPDLVENLEETQKSYENANALTEQDTETLKQKLFTADNGLDVLKNVIDLSSFIVGIAFAIAGISTAVAAVIPGLSVIALGVGLFMSYRNAKNAKKDMIEATNKVRDDLTKQINLRFGKMEQYIDQSTMALEKSLLQGDYKQMDLYVADCLEINELEKRQTCMLDRCSFAKSGFYKFAVYYDEVTGTGTDENTYPAQFVKKFNGLSKLQLRRIQANLVLFDTYVRHSLIKCESIIFLDKMMKAYSDTAEVKQMAQQDLDDQIKAGVEKWTLRNKVLDYLVKAQNLIIYGYNQATEGFSRDNRVMERSISLDPNDKVNIKYQCRYRMNSMNFDQCDREIHVEISLWKSLFQTKSRDKPKYFESEDAFLKHKCVEETKFGDWTYKAKVNKDIREMYDKQLANMKKAWKDVYDLFYKEVKKNRRRDIVVNQPGNETTTGSLRSFDKLEHHKAKKVIKKMKTPRRQ